MDDLDPSITPDSPAEPVTKLPVWPWFVSYCVLMVMVAVLFAVFGGYMLNLEPAQLLKYAPKADPAETARQFQLRGIIAILAGGLMFGAFAAAPFLPRKPWVWVFDLVLICAGVLGFCVCLPVTAPLLLFWMKEDTQAAFGRSRRTAH